MITKMMTARNATIGIGVVLVLALCVYGEKYSADKKMQALCAKDGGVKIYETVVVPKNQFDKWGMPRGPKWDGSHFPSTLDPAYAYTNTSEFLKRGDPLKGEVEMWRDHAKLYRQSDGKLLGEAITYGRRGGDQYIGLLLGGHPSGVGCPVQSKHLISVIFLKEE